ncbi:MAG: peptidoglycan-binding protein [Clostridia bacterium]|nr:peptidoglycan-binding protein [Clostridia bacterium]
MAKDEILRYGDKGTKVEELQLELRRAGFLPSAPDGIFGPATQRAVREFQQAAGLKSDGLVGPLTKKMLRPYLTGYAVHTVKKGDTFWKLAQSYATDAEAIQTANPSVNPNNLRVGSRLIIPLGFPVVANDVTYSSSLCTAFTEGLLARYPFLESRNIGKSVLGVPLQAISMGKGSAELFVNAAHHANEWITVPVVLHFLESYCRAWAAKGEIGGQNAQRLYELTTLWLVPMVDPDGIDFINGVLPNGPKVLAARQYAADYPQISYPQGWKANINGVDLNLQYPANWETARRIKFAQGFTSPAPRDFVGRAPLTEPESASLVRFTQSRNFAASLSYHSQGQVIYWDSPAQSCVPPSGEALGNALAQASGYALEPTPAASANAGYRDWFVQSFCRPGYTVEVGSGVNPLPVSQLPDLFRQNDPLIAAALHGISR